MSGARKLAPKPEGLAGRSPKSNDEGHGRHEDGEGPGGGRQDEGGHRSVSLPPIQPIPRHTPALHAALQSRELSRCVRCLCGHRTQKTFTRWKPEWVGAALAFEGAGVPRKRNSHCARLAAVGSGANSAAFGDACVPCVPCLPCQTAQSRPTRSRKTTRNWWKRTNS
eukprot:COSAG06_NODE_4839_length_3918_cov_1.490966_5_plen_167_part_00